MVSVFGMDEFFERIDCCAAEWFDARDANGHPDLPDYLPHMGPRYSLKGYERPISVFRGEGRVLYLIARTVQPERVAECYTGTGYAAACLAAGWPDALVYSVADYSEGNVGDRGHHMAQALRDRLDLKNLILLRGSLPALGAVMGWQADLVFLDGPYGETPPAKETVTVIRHDDENASVPGRRFLVKGGSHFWVTCPTVEARDVLASVVAELMPVELG